jgi:hypothetical protein
MNIFQLNKLYLSRLLGSLDCVYYAFSRLAKAFAPAAYFADGWGSEEKSYLLQKRVIGILLGFHLILCNQTLVKPRCEAFGSVVCANGRVALQTLEQLIAKYGRKCVSRHATMIILSVRRCALQVFFAVSSRPVLPRVLCTSGE